MVSFDRLDSMRQDDSLDKLRGDKEGGGNTGDTKKKIFTFRNSNKGRDSLYCIELATVNNV